MPESQDKPGVSGENNNNSQEKMAAAEVRIYLSGLDYPRSKTELVNYAKTKKAPESVVIYLRRLPEKPYTSPADVELEFRKL
jgi:hypothetical protein